MYEYFSQGEQRPLFPDDCPQTCFPLLRCTNNFETPGPIQRLLRSLLFSQTGKSLLAAPLLIALPRPRASSQRRVCLLLCPFSGSSVSRRSLQSVLDVVFSLTVHAPALLSPSTPGERLCEVLAMIIRSSSPQGICAIVIKLEWQ
jgi:hypothetical protein